MNLIYLISYLILGSTQISAETRHIEQSTSCFQIVLNPKRCIGIPSRSQRFLELLLRRVSGVAIPRVHEPCAIPFSGVMPHSGPSSTQGDEASASAGGLHPDPTEHAAFLLQEAEDNSSVSASPVLRLPRFPSECWPPNAPLMHRSKSWPSRVVRSRHRTRGRAAIPRPLPAVEYPPGIGDDYYGAGHLMDQHAAPQMPLFLSLFTGPAPNLASDAA